MHMTRQQAINLAVLLMDEQNSFSISAKSVFFSSNKSVGTLVCLLGKG